ncbi:MAG TPA: hypothetical protein VI434_13450 [Candidatus Dormibacteraeota bacterium]
MLVGMTRVADITKWAALILIVMVFAFYVAALPADLDQRFKDLFFHSALVSGALAVVVAVLAILANIFVFVARRSSHLTR